MSREEQSIEHVLGRFQARYDPEKMRFEVGRIKTFKTWSKEIPIRPGPLAKNGFYYVGIFDIVECFSCKGQIEGWEEGDTAMGEHKKMYPDCKMVKNKEQKNVTIEKSNEIRIRLREGGEQIDGQVVLTTNRTSDVMTSDDYVDAYCGTSFSERLTPAKYPLLVDESRRLDTFRDWPGDSKLPSKKTLWLANAGFFHAGPGDRARCFYCNGGIECWEKDDEPWREHAKNFPKCEWLIERKGNEFVDAVQNAKAREEAEEKKKTERSAAHTQSSASQTCQKRPVSEAGQSQKETRVIPSTKLVEMMESPTVKMIVKAGFDAALVCRVLEAQMREGELNFTSSDNFIKALRTAEKQKDGTDGTPGDYSVQSSSINTQTQRFSNLEITGDQRQEKSQTTQPDPGSFVTAKSSVGNQSSKTASPTGPTTGYPQWTGLERLVCRVCSSQDVSTVFCPCNHEAACLQCARVALTCPECGSPVNTYERTSGFI